MAKCGIVTIYDNNYNYGGQLQAFAMVQLLSGFGCDSRVVSFSADNSKYVLQRVKELGLVEILKRSVNKFRFLIYMKKSNHSAEIKKKIQRFDSFISSIPHTQRVYKNELAELDNQFDLFVCGSDQIWNPGWWNDVYFLSFTNKPKFSYAASIGRDSLNERELKHIEYMTRDYIGISVREKSAENILTTKIGKKVHTVLDPTMMIDVSIWESMAELCNETDYALVYKIGNVTETAKEAYRYCQDRGIRVISIGHTKNTFEKDDDKIADIIVDSAGPKEWLGLIKQAKYIFTDSFHGTVFSLLFNKEFWCFEKKDRSAISENTRIYSILDLVGLRRRMVQRESFQNVSLLEDVIDYENVQRMLDSRRRASVDYIKMCLKAIST